MPKKLPIFVQACLLNNSKIILLIKNRATGQSHKPTPPTLIINSTTQTKAQGDADKARKHGMEEYIQADPSVFNHNELFKTLQSLTLEYRLSDQFCSLGWFSPGQIFVLDEYQAR